MRYRVTHTPHFINDRLVYPDRGEASVITLPDGVKPGKWLVPVSGEVGAKEKPATAAKANQADAGSPGDNESGRFIAVHKWAGNYQIIAPDGSDYGELITKAVTGGSKPKDYAQAEADRLNAELDKEGSGDPDDGTGDDDQNGDNLPDA